MTAERFNDFGSLYVLENQQWKKVGNGTLSMITNAANLSQMIVKIDGKDIDKNIGQVFQCKPKTKPKGNKSYILKGNNTNQNKEYILAARFKSIDTAKAFKLAIESAFNLWQESLNNPSASSLSSPSSPSATTNTTTTNGKYDHSRHVTKTPEELRKQLSTKEWDCKLCTSHNLAKAMQCRVCKSPRLIMLKKALSCDDLSVSSTSCTSIATNNNNNNNTQSLAVRIDANNVSLNTIYGDLNAPLSPNTSHHGSFDWTSSDANTKLHVTPNIHDIDSTKKDFIRILTTIESNITHQDPLKLFDDLSKVAKRLMRKDIKYRVLDLKNPVVQERLINIAGVDAYLKYLGFEESSNQKLICPDDQPPRSVIKTAMEVCKEFLIEWKKKQKIFDLLTQSTKDILEMEHKKSPNTASAAAAASASASASASTVSKNIVVADDDKKQIDPDNADDEYTLRQLVWSITHESSHSDGQNQTADVLLLCHSVFAESSDLLALLIERFRGKTTIHGAQAQLMNNKKIADSIWNTQVKVGSMLSSWMKTFWAEDWDAQPQLMEDMEAFFESLNDTKDKRVKVLLNKMSGIYDMQYNKYQNDLIQKQKKRKMTHKNVLKTLGKPKNFNISDQKPKILAEQITLMHFKAFKAIEKRECLGQSWKKKDGNLRAPNVLNMIKLFNQTAKWVQILILTQPNIKKRAKTIKLCILISVYLKEYRNFSGSCAFHSALTSTPIHRLKACWSLVSQSDKKKFDEIKQIFGFGNNWIHLRKLHRTAHAPAILHTGLFLQDLVGIDEGTNDHTKNGKVNFKKLLKLHEKIDTIAMYQQEEYSFKENLMIESVILEDFKAQVHIDDDFLFKISCSVKASDQKKK